VLYRLTRHYQPNNIIELGTSLGITTSYLALANPAVSVTTIEGSDAIAAIAEDNFKKLNSQNVRLIRGNFDTVLAPLIESTPSMDLAFIDGNHRYQPTMNYFHRLLTKTHANTILIFDDIHWSADMEKAWQEIKDHPSVQYTIDIFFLGFVFFRSEFKVKQHFTIRY
jgi:predicted O-methyltransferase YrrM